MKKAICKKGTQCSLWKKELFHTVLFMHGPESTNVTETENVKKKSTKEGPPSKKRAVESPHISKTQKFLEEKYLVFFPADFVTFWNNLELFENSKTDICGMLYGAFKAIKNLRFVGPFEVLAEKADGKEIEHDNNFFLTAHRYATDLPEMQTLAVYDGGRYAFWRDTPKTKEVYIINVQHNEEHFPKAEIVGDADPRWIIVHLCAGVPPQQLPSSDQKLWGSLEKTYQQELKRILRERNKITYGEAFHGLGIYVTVESDVGYRPLENPPPVKLKKYIKDFATTEDEKKKDILRNEILNCTTYVDIANDEMDYSLGLEVGHDLFWSNYAAVDRLAKITLSNSYTLLERNEFGSILEAHMKVRRDDPTLNH